eukprot:scaffold3221_cov194-Amphora_coffeaeformis.AAC.3
MLSRKVLSSRILLSTMAARCKSDEDGTGSVENMAGKIQLVAEAPYDHNGVRGGALAETETGVEKSRQAVSPTSAKSIVDGSIAWVSSGPCMSACHIPTTINVRTMLSEFHWPLSKRFYWASLHGANE